MPMRWSDICEKGKSKSSKHIMGLLKPNSGVVIVDVESNDDLFDVLNRLPLSGYLEWEVIPLIPADRALESAKWALQQLNPGSTR